METQVSGDAKHMPNQKGAITSNCKNTRANQEPEKWGKWYITVSYSVTMVQRKGK